MRKKAAVVVLIVAMISCSSGCGIGPSQNVPIVRSDLIQVIEDDGIEIKEPSSLGYKFLGDWEVKRLLKYGRATMYGSEEVDSIIGSKIIINEKYLTTNNFYLGGEGNPNFSRQELPYLNAPIYKENIVSRIDFINGSSGVTFEDIGVSSDSITMLEIYMDKEYNDPWYLGVLYMSEDNSNRSILLAGGVYLEVERVE